MPQKKHIKKKFFFYLKENFVTLGGGRLGAITLIM